MNVKEFLQKVIRVCRILFGYGIMLSLFVGGLTFFGYVAALIIGGDTAAAICTFLYKTVMPIAIKTSTVMVLFGLVIMYMNGEVALTSNKKKAMKHDSET